MGDILNNVPDISGITDSIGKLGSLGSSFSPDQLLANIKTFFDGIVEKVVALVPGQVMDIYNTHKVLCILALVCILGVIAFEGYKVFRMVTYAGSAFLFGLIGFWYIAPALEGTLKPMIPEMLDYHTLVGVVCALIAIVLCACAFKFAIFIVGGIAGYVLGSGYIYGMLVSFFDSLTFLQNDTVKTVVGGIFAVLGALVFALMFKFVFVATTSFGGAIGACVLLQSILIPGANDTIKIAFEVAGIILAILALIRQHKQEEDLVFRL
ncbi:MAG: hypothetical protein IJX58_01805 [Clostridia bacterium]|nr:hypothetical protein [Clostridia bacterium]